MLTLMNVSVEIKPQRSQILIVTIRPCTLPLLRSHLFYFSIHSFVSFSIIIFLFASAGAHPSSFGPYIPFSAACIAEYRASTTASHTGTGHTRIQARGQSVVVSHRTKDIRHHPPSTMQATAFPTPVSPSPRTLAGVGRYIESDATIEVMEEDPSPPHGRGHGWPGIRPGTIFHQTSLQQR